MTKNFGFLLSLKIFSETPACLLYRFTIKNTTQDNRRAIPSWLLSTSPPKTLRFMHSTVCLSGLEPPSMNLIEKPTMQESKLPPMQLSTELLAWRVSELTTYWRDSKQELPMTKLVSNNIWLEPVYHVPLVYYCYFHIILILLNK